jgi:hypothetical protein
MVKVKANRPVRVRRTKEETEEDQMDENQKEEKS